MNPHIARIVAAIRSVSYRYSCRSLRVPKVKHRLLLEVVAVVEGVLVLDVLVPLQLSNLVKDYDLHKRVFAIPALVAPTS